MEKHTVDIDVLLEYKDFLRNIFWQTFKKTWFIFLLALLLTPLFFYGVFAMILTGKFSAGIFLPSLPFIAVLMNLYGVRSSAKKSFENLKGKIQWSFSDEGFKTFTAVGTSENNWEGLEEIKETNNDFLLFIQKPIFIIIPKRCFQNESDILEFKQIVERNLGSKAKLKND